MPRSHGARALALCGAAFLMCALVGPEASATQIQALTNGDFETGDLTGWTETDQGGSVGTWLVSSPGTPTPLSGAPTAGNAGGGSWYAVSDQYLASCSVLLQSFTIPPGAVNVTLSYQMFVNNWSEGGTVIDPSGLDYSTGGTGDPNQHGRVDILTWFANPFDTGAGVLDNLYIGADPSATNPNDYTSYSFNLTSLLGGGGTFQVRFAEVDNQDLFNQGVDNVSLTFELTPEPCTLSLLAFGALGLLGRARRRRR